MTQQPTRISGLDSLRGIAALIVVFFHYQLSLFHDFEKSFLQQHTFIHWIFDGRMAVMLFFVLSGFVLALPFQDNIKTSYGKFLIRRFCRIYLPFVVAILVAASLWWGMGTEPIYDFGWNGWASPLTISNFFSHLFATGLVGGDYLNPPIWTLVQEMRVAIIFPALVYCVRKAGGVAVVAAMIGGYLGSKGYAALEPGATMNFSHSLSGTLYLTAYYIQFFVMGIYLALYRNQWMSIMDKLPSWIFVGIGFVLLMVPVSDAYLPYTLHELYLAGIGIFLIMTCVRFQRFQTFLSFAPFQWLGKVSYSLYLSHGIIMMAMKYGLHPYMSMGMSLLLAFPLILITAHLMQKYVESPSHELGKKLTSRMA